MRVSIGTAWAAFLIAAVASSTVVAAEVERGVIRLADPANNARRMMAINKSGQPDPKIHTAIVARITAEPS